MTIRPGINRLVLEVPDARCCKAEDARLFVSRPGGCDWVEYAGWEHDDEGRLVFLLDDAITRMAPGRYWGDVAYCDCCYRIQIEIPPCPPLKSAQIDHQDEPCPEAPACPTTP